MSDDDERNEDPMLGFMFGNVGEDSELEEEYELDKVGGGRVLMKKTTVFFLFECSTG